MTTDALIVDLTLRWSPAFLIPAKLSRFHFREKYARKTLVYIRFKKIQIGKLVHTLNSRRSVLTGRSGVSGLAVESRGSAGSDGSDFSDGSDGSGLANFALRSCGSPVSESTAGSGHSRGSLGANETLHTLLSRGSDRSNWTGRSVLTGKS